MSRSQQQSGNSQTQNPSNQKKAFKEGEQDNSTKLNNPENKNDRERQKNPTNSDNKITNSQDQNRIEEDVEEKSIPSGSKRDDGDPEINTPVYTPDKTEEKIPRM